MRAAGLLRAAVLLLAAADCQDNGRTGPPDTPAQLAASYVCGNDFELSSRISSATTVAYQVAGTDEAGELRLPPGSPDTPSHTRLSTIASGDLTLSDAGGWSSTVTNEGRACPLPPATSDPRSRTGEWTPPFEWPVVAVHLHQLPDGRVLSWGRAGEPTLWDPSSLTFTTAPSSTMLFCGGHSFLADGRLLVVGGHLDDERGLPDANIFGPSPDRWTTVDPMHWGRWYPTSTSLPSGEVVVLAGKDENRVDVPVPEVWNGSSWRTLTGAARALPYYPRTFVAPNGLVFYAGELAETGYLDVSGAGSWTHVATSNYGRRDYGTAVMYRPGKVIIVGGSNPPDGVPTATAEVIDLAQPSPSWQYSSAMTFPRRHLNATLLPDGTVLVTGGTSSAGFSNPAGAVHAAELWNPADATWSVLAGNQVNRVYHSTTILLPDGRLLHAGSGDGPGLPRELNAELFSPPYLFRGPRPSILEAPKLIGYGEEFPVRTDDAGEIVRVTLLRLSSVTHAFDQSQRFVELSLRRVAGGLVARAPASGALAPPGPYVMFLLNSLGVPSPGVVLQVG